MSAQKEKFIEFQNQEGDLKLASDSVTASVKGKGRLPISINKNNYVMEDTLYVPDLAMNLMSVSQMTDSVGNKNNHIFHFDSHLFSLVKIVTFYRQIDSSKKSL